MHKQECSRFKAETRHRVIVNHQNEYQKNVYPWVQFRTLTYYKMKEEPEYIRNNCKFFMDTAEQYQQGRCHFPGPCDKQSDVACQMYMRLALAFIHEGLDHKKIRMLLEAGIQSTHSEAVSSAVFRQLCHCYMLVDDRDNALKYAKSAVMSSDEERTYKLTPNNETQCQSYSLLAFSFCHNRDLKQAESIVRSTLLLIDHHEWDVKIELNSCLAKCRYYQQKYPWRSDISCRIVGKKTRIE